MEQQNPYEPPRLLTPEKQATPRRCSYDSVPKWRLIVLKMFAAFEHWWFYLMGTVGFAFASYSTKDVIQRTFFSFGALLNLISLFLLFFKGPHFGKILRELRDTRKEES